MPLKVVPAGDERCDVHNHRTPQRYVCEACLKEFGIQSPESEGTTVHGPSRRTRRRRALRRWRSRIDQKVLIGAGVGLILLIAVLASGILGGDDGGDEAGAPSESDVVNALDLLPNPSGSGWITSDGLCAVVSIDRSELAQPAQEGEELSIEATNEDGTVSAVVIQNDFSISQAECVSRVDTALKAEF